MFNTKPAITGNEVTCPKEVQLSLYGSGRFEEKQVITHLRVNVSELTPIKRAVNEC